MQSEHKLSDDIARLAAGGLGGLSSLKQEFDRRVRDQIDRVLQRAELATREEYDVLKTMAERARTDQDLLSARLDRIEAALRKAGIEI